MHWARLYRSLEESGEPFVMVTVTEVRGSTPRETGARCFVTPDGRLHGTIGGGTLEEEARLRAVTLLQTAATAEAEGLPAPLPETRGYRLDEVLGQCCGGQVTLLFEAVTAAYRLYVFGAGHVGRALASVLAETRVAVTVIDPRPEFADPRRFPPGVDVIAADPLALIPELVFHAGRIHVAILTHSHCLDRQILEQVLARPARYVGLIGSRAKRARFETELRERGVSEAALARVQCPMGLPLGDKRPAEVAVSIAAEILAGLPRTSKGLEAKAAASASLRPAADS